MEKNRISYLILVVLLLVSCSDTRKTYFSNGALKEEFKIVDNKKNGEYKRYFKSGQLSLKGLFKNDRESGSFIGYFENGVKKFTRNYVNGSLSGLQFSYYANGEVAEVSSYYAGEPHGNSFFIDSLSRDTLAYLSYENGKPMYEKVYHTGKRENIQIHNMVPKIDFDKSNDSSLCFEVFAPVDINLILVVGRFVGDNYEIPDTLSVKQIKGRRVCYQVSTKGGPLNAHLMELGENDEIIGGTLIDIQLEDYFN